MLLLMPPHQPHQQAGPSEAAVHSLLPALPAAAAAAGRPQLLNPAVVGLQRREPVLGGLVLLELAKLLDDQPSQPLGGPIVSSVYCTPSLFTLIGKREGWGALAE